VLIGIGRGQAEPPILVRRNQPFQFSLNHIPGDLFHREISPGRKPGQAHPVVGIGFTGLFVRVLDGVKVKVFEAPGYGVSKEEMGRADFYLFFGFDECQGCVVFCLEVVPGVQGYLLPLLPAPDFVTPFPRS
jgi:hypothetical protein